MTHALVVYGPSERADAVLRDLAREGARLTVVALGSREPEQSGCCDTRSVLWNDVVRGLVRDDLDRARLALEHDGAADFGALAFEGRHAADAIVREARERAADAIVLADRRALPLGALGRRRLRRTSPVPVLDP